MSDFTAGAARRSFLEPALDGRALNLEQAELLVNETPELDSITECIELIREHPEISGHPVVHLLVELVERLVASNEAEGELEREVAGAADVLVTELRRAELNGVANAITAKAIVRSVRGPLRAIEDGGSGDELLEAFGALHHVFSEVSRAQLLSPTVRRALGDRKFELLEQLAGADSKAVV